MKWQRIYRRIGRLTLVAVYALILIGGFVRASGSGMGCPDWPKCFGTWIPPTSVDQLPDNYQEIFGEKLKGEVVFNPTKTWIEYFNRLVGVLIGILIFSTFVISIRAFWKKDKFTVLVSFLAFLLVSFEGWLGSKVVSSELHPGLITAHMLISILIVFLLLYGIIRSKKTRPIWLYDPAVNFLLLLAIFISIGQIILGSQVRETVDQIVNQMNISDRSQWSNLIGGKLYFHAFLGFMTVVVNFLLVNRLGIDLTLQKRALLFVVLLSFFTGALMGFYEFSPFFQPLHLAGSVIIIGIQFTILLAKNPNIVRFLK